ncbi:hypothetical protein [Rubripirellula reticaptiva]|uniref:Uncharacterized protein n=1 Tax=Rubripirellula reticaptiva TaxID=2528013 RepID=A0A5C6EX94_9BACT|nr:hypothetical protein [Rubripirellula reticaptiva]TWU51831.1 hypothetical protein Poly59_34260 [Rubripirellula reticaptiva]
MAFSLRYQSTEAMHPARAFEIKADAAILVAKYQWTHCQAIDLDQPSDGRLVGISENDPEWSNDFVDTKEDVPVGTVIVIAELLCELSRRHRVGWELADADSGQSIGEIRSGTIESRLITQLQWIHSADQMLDETSGDGDDESSDLLDENEWYSVGMNLDIDVNAPVVKDDHDDGEDDGPRLLKFPGK